MHSTLRYLKLTLHRTNVRSFMCNNSKLNMRFIQFSKPENPHITHLGVLKDSNIAGRVIHVSGIEPKIPGNLFEYIKQHDVISAQLHRAVEQASHGYVYDISTVQLLAPITNPDKVICVGLNYKRHCDEQNVPYPDVPFFFNKFPSCIIGPGATIRHPQNTKTLDWEVELAVIIGKECKNIKIDDAYDYIFGYTVAQDISARDWQTPKKNKGQWLMAKSMDTFCPLGPMVVTKDEIIDPHELTLSCSVNKEQKQHSKTDDLIHRIDKIIAYLSECFTLLPGDVILTGTPSGVGVFRKPPQYLKPGDIIDSEISGIGRLTNVVGI